MIYLLDTNVCIALMRGHVEVCRMMRSQRPSDCVVSTVSLYELQSGVERCRQPVVERQKVEAFLRPLNLQSFDAEAAGQTARIRWSLEQRGQMIGPYDLMLAGQALAFGLILVTHNQNEFRRIHNLQLEDWETS